MFAPAVVLATTAVASAVMQGQAQTAQLEAQESALEEEKKYLAQQRVFLEEAKEEELDLFREQTRELLGVQEVSFARAGIEMSGSALRILRETSEDALAEEGRITKQYAQYRTLSEMKADAINRQKTSISNMKGLIPMTTALSAVTGGTTGWYTGKKISG